MGPPLLGGILGYGGEPSPSPLAPHRTLYEHTFVEEKGSAGAVFWRAIQNHNVTAAEGAAWEIQAQTKQPIPFDFALALTHLYGENGDGRYELAALRYLGRYIEEAKPSLLDVAESRRCSRRGCGAELLSIQKTR